MAQRSQCKLRKAKSFGLLACGSSRRVIESRAVGKLMAATSGSRGYTMKFIVACILIAIALYLVLDQQGAVDATLQQINNGKAAATWRGR